MGDFVVVLALESFLREWKAAPAERVLRDYAVMRGWRDSADPGFDRPPSAERIARAKAEFRRLAPTHFRKMFPEES